MADLSVPCRALIHGLFEGDLSREEFREKALEIQTRQPMLFDDRPVPLPRLTGRLVYPAREEVKAETLPGPTFGEGRRS
ncbi:MAG: hypothetical protein ACE5DW_06830 [Thermodesulfobacteriota bacterium]